VTKPLLNRNGLVTGYYTAHDSAALCRPALLALMHQALRCQRRTFELKAGELADAARAGAAALYRPTGPPAQRRRRSVARAPGHTRWPGLRPPEDAVACTAYCSAISVGVKPHRPHTSVADLGLQRKQRRQCALATLRRPTQTIVGLGSTRRVNVRSVTTGSGGMSVTMLRNLQMNPPST
jgi:hypothetical protein